MLGVRAEQSKIVRVVVRRAFVSVIHDFFSPKIPTELLLHHEAVFTNVSVTIRVGVLGSVDQNVAVLVLSTAALPGRIVRSRLPVSVLNPVLGHSPLDDADPDSKPLGDLSAR